MTIGKRTIEDYQEFKSVQKELDQLEKTMWGLTNDTWIHNHITDAVREVDEKLIDKYVAKLRTKKRIHDSTEIFITWMHIWENDERIIDNLNPDKIYNSFLDAVKKTKETLPKVMERVEKLKMDKSKFERYVLSLTVIGGGVGQSESQKAVHYLYETVKIIPRLERLAGGLSEEYESLSSKFDKAESLYRWFNVKREELDENTSVVGSVKSTVEYEIELIEKEIDKIRSKKQEFERIRKESDIALRWDGVYIDVSYPGGGTSIPEGHLKRGKHYTISSRLDMRRAIDRIIEKKGKVMIMGNTLYRDENGRLTADTEVNLDQVLLNCIPEPIVTPSGVVEPSEWVKQETEQLRSVSKSIVDYLKSQKGIFGQKKINYEGIHKSTCTIPGVEPYEFKRALLDPLVEDGQIAQDEEVYWYTEGLERFNEVMTSEIERFRQKGFNVKYQEGSKRLTIQVNLPSKQLREEIAIEMAMRRFKPKTLLIYPTRAGAGFCYKNNMEVFSEREDVFPPSVPGLYVGSKSPKEMIEEADPNKTYINLEFEYQGLKAQEEIKKMLGILYTTLSSLK